jgi:hypothetical protein
MLWGVGYAAWGPLASHRLVASSRLTVGLYSTPHGEMLTCFQTSFGVSILVLIRPDLAIFQFVLGFYTMAKHELNICA